jgi:hypothetical protein
MNNEYFQLMCKDFEAGVIEGDHFSFLNGETGFVLGNDTWFVEIVCRDRDLADAKEPLLQLVRNRKELMYKLLVSESFSNYLINAHNLATWLSHRGYGLSIGSHTWWGKFRIWILSKTFGVVKM